MDYERVLKELEKIVAETYALWDHNRVGFYWRNYPLNHTFRVRAMCLELGRREGGDLDKLAFAATLHDITKRYDGEILKDLEGNRVVGEDGLWKNEMILPNSDRGNIVTKLYHEADLYYKPHNISGATVARKLLDMYGLPEDFSRSVEAIIRAHLRPGNLLPDEHDRIYRSIESRILYDADVMDANLGYVAFYRNIQIHSYYMIQRKGKFDLKDYIQTLPEWISRKGTFIEKLFTDSAHEIAGERQKRKRDLYAQLEVEKENYDLNAKYGLLGMVNFFVSYVSDPDLPKELELLKRDWIPKRERWIHEEKGVKRESAKQSLSRVIDFCCLLEKEMEGKL